MKKFIVDKNNNIVATVRTDKINLQDLESREERIIDASEAEADVNPNNLGELEYKDGKIKKKRKKEKTKKERDKAKNDKKKHDLVTRYMRKKAEAELVTMGKINAKGEVIDDTL